MAVLTEEQIMLKDAASAWVRQRAPVAELRKLRNSEHSLGYDPELYKEMVQMGWTGILVPEEFGGADFGFKGLGIVLEELGKNLVASPLISSGLSSAFAITLAGSQAQKEMWLPKISDGSVIAALAIDDGARHTPLNTTLTATKIDNNWVLNGVKAPVTEGMGADVLIVTAQTSDTKIAAHGLTMFLVETDKKGLSRTPLGQIDSRTAARYVFDQVSVTHTAVLGEQDKAAEPLEKILNGSCAGLAAEMYGTASEAFDMTLEYLKIREQFGQTIGSFQALQHRATAMYGELKLTRTAVHAALEALDTNSPKTSQLVSLAKIMASDTLKLVTNEMVQMHGGIGMTDEHDAGLYLKRARVAAASYGNAAYHRERYAKIFDL